MFILCQSIINLLSLHNDLYFVSSYRSVTLTTSRGYAKKEKCESWSEHAEWVYSPSKPCWNEETRLGQGKVYSSAQTTKHCLGGGEQGEKLRQIMSIVLRVLKKIAALKVKLLKLQQTCCSLVESTMCSAHTQSAGTALNRTARRPQLQLVLLEKRSRYVWNMLFSLYRKSYL